MRLAKEAGAPWSVTKGVPCFSDLIPQRLVHVIAILLVAGLEFLVRRLIFLH
jgi:hypothetical protein